jgi:hypothetical protein
MKDYRLTIAGGGVGCRFELAALSAVVRVLGLVGYRGLYAAASLISKAFPEHNTVVLSDG